MKMKNGSRVSITEGVIWKQILLYFFPLLFGTFFQQLYNTIDAVVVGRYVGKEALSAVGGTTGTLINVFIGFFVGISSGATVIISQYFGGKKEKEVNDSVHTAMALAVTGGFLIMLIGFFGSSYALKLMGTPDEIYKDALTFIRIYFLGTVFNLVYNMGAGILRAIGDSKRPLYFLMISCGVNILLDILFVVGFHWGVGGTAAATVLSQLLSACLVCMILIKTDECYKLSLSKIRFHKEILKKIINIGLPAGAQSLMYTTSNILIQSSMNSFSINVLAAWTVYGKIDGIFWMIMNSFGVAVTTFVGQNFGAGEKQRVQKGIRICLVFAMASALLLSIILSIFAEGIMTFFNKDPAVIQEGLKILHFLVPTYCTYVLVEILSGSLRGMGQAVVPFILTFLGVGVRIIWILSAVPVWHEVKTVIFSYPLAWSVTSVLFVIYYFYFKKKSGLVNINI
ncbi:MATE family efflux transporter [Anaerocolumna xylanovorans]|uniref:Probable multidrug resistance protein NorM n=1 Tax=Anaerocolumna xylanovorans DSM 12503 TaxID=1121345 RepID=A0A1M7Y1C5_9FIRM|nr:MATE family efflux transporter [Anaerocolumna xylanovorans]SHO45553.1 putative efflux protein, MATE family [Anaerocolumna xylanovorans DSM 12503]